MGRPLHRTHSETRDTRCSLENSSGTVPAFVLVGTLNTTSSYGFYLGLLGGGSALSGHPWFRIDGALILWPLLGGTLSFNVLHPQRFLLYILVCS
jgi:hypothetical protein